MDSPPEVCIYTCTTMCSMYVYVLHIDMYMCYVYGVKSVIPVLRSKHADTWQICPALQIDMYKL